VRGFGSGTHWWLLTFFSWIVPRNRLAEEVQVFREGIRNRSQNLTSASERGEFIRDIIQNVSMGRSWVRIDLVHKDLCRDSSKGKWESETAQVFREHCSVNKVLACQVVGANMDEGSIETEAVEKSVKNGHRFGVVRSWQAKRAACTIRKALIEQNIAPTSRTSTRVFCDDSRAVCDKNSGVLIWRRVWERVKEFSSRECKNFDARLKPLAERKSRFGLWESAQGAKTCSEPRRSFAVSGKLIANKLRGSRV